MSVLIQSRTTAVINPFRVEGTSRTYLHVHTAEGDGFFKTDCCVDDMMNKAELEFEYISETEEKTFLDNLASPMAHCPLTAVTSLYPDVVEVVLQPMSFRNGIFLLANPNTSLVTDNGPIH